MNKKIENETKTQKKKKDRKGLFYYLNTNNLIGELELYSCKYTPRKMLFSYLIAILCGIAAGLLFSIPWYGLMILAASAIIAAPRLIVNAYHTLYQQRLFSDASKYLEKMIYYFKRSQKTLTCLQEILVLYPDGPMHDAIEKAIHHATETDYSWQGKEDALKIIEETFRCSRIRKLHRYILSVEQNGGNCEMAADLLLEDRAMWVNRVFDLQKKKKINRTNILIAIVVASVLCLAILYLPGLIPSSVQIPKLTSYPLVQVTAIIYLILQLLIYLKADKQMCIDWLDDTDKMTEEEAFKKYSEILNYSPAAEFKGSIIWAAVAAAATAVLFLILRSPFILLPGIALIVFMLNQHAIGHALAKRKYIREIEKAFPSWLMDVALLLQTENVRVAIKKSYDGAPNLIKPAVFALLQELSEDPTSEKPYLDFLSYFDLSDISDAMAALYSRSSGSGGDPEEEFKGIIVRTHAMLDSAEKLRNEDKIATIGMYIVLPGVIGAIKLSIDMAALLLAFFSIKIV